MFAKRVAPQEFWETPLFAHINVVLATVWVASFAVTAAVLAMGLAMAPHDVGILLGGQVAGFVVPMRITRRYPARARRALRRRVSEAAFGRSPLGLASSFRRLRIHVLSPRSPAHLVRRIKSRADQRIALAEATTAPSRGRDDNVAGKRITRAVSLAGEVGSSC